MLGEFMPLVMMVVKYRAVTPLTITMYKTHKRFPLNVFYRELEAAVPTLRIHVHGDIERIDRNYTALQPLDNVTYDELVRSGDDERLRTAVEFVRELVTKRVRKDPKDADADADPHVVVPIRTGDKKMTRYYDTHFADKWGKAESFIKTHGAQRRRVTNMQEVVNALRRRYRHQKRVVAVSSDSTVPLFDQVVPYLNSDVLVLEHGAAMFFALFLRPRSTIVEIIPRNKMANVHQKAVQALKWVAKLGGHTLRRVVVTDSVAKVRVAEVLACLSAGE
jgi:hypothetical protein